MGADVGQCVSQFKANDDRLLVRAQSICGGIEREESCPKTVSEKKKDYGIYKTKNNANDPTWSS